MVLILDKDSLSEDELCFVHDIFRNPETHTEHSVTVHERLSSLHKRCILCLLGSKVA
jgi:hypothetical protein